MFGLFSKKNQEKKSDFEIEKSDDEEDSAFLRSLKVNFARLIAYAESADIQLQREVAEKLANEAVNPNRQVLIVENGGISLLVPLTKSQDGEVQRLAAHALANLSVNSETQKLMAQQGAIEMLIRLLDSDLELTQRQAAKALANLGVNPDNKRHIAISGGIPKLVKLADSPNIPVRIEAIAALANLAVNDLNEIEIVKAGGLAPITHGATLAAETLTLSGKFRTGTQDRSEKDIANLEELAAQCSRALRNLSVNNNNKTAIIGLGGVQSLYALCGLANDRISQQARRALRNLDPEGPKK